MRFLNIFRSKSKKKQSNQRIEQELKTDNDAPFVLTETDKSTNEDVQLQNVTFGQDILQDILANDKSWEFREAAIDKITDQSILLTLCTDLNFYKDAQMPHDRTWDSDDSSRHTIAKKLANCIDESTDLNLIERIAKEATHENLLEPAILKSTDQEWIGDAIDCLTDQQILTNIAKYFQNWEICSDAIEKIHDPNVLEDISNNAFASGVASVAMEKLKALQKEDKYLNTEEAYLLLIDILKVECYDAANYRCSELIKNNTSILYQAQTCLLVKAIEGGKLDLTEILLKNGADSNKSGSNLMTPILAVIFRSLEDCPDKIKYLELLINYGAINTSLRIKGFNNYDTELDVAKDHCHTTYDFLISKGWKTLDNNNSQGIDHNEDKGKSDKSKKLIQEGSKYLTGDGVEKDPMKAASFYAQAGEAGNSNGYFLVGEMFKTHNPKVAREAFEKGAMLNNTQCMSQLGSMCLLEETDENNKKTAFKWCKKGAEMGDPKCAVTLGILFKNGIGTVPDIKHANTWFKVAAGSNDPNILQALQTMGVIQDRKFCVVPFGNMWAVVFINAGITKGVCATRRSKETAQTVADNIRNLPEFPDVRVAFGDHDQIPCVNFIVTEQNVKRILDWLIAGEDAPDPIDITDAPDNDPKVINVHIIKDKTGPDTPTSLDELSRLIYEHDSC